MVVDQHLLIGRLRRDVMGWMGRQTCVALQRATNLDNAASEPFSRKRLSQYSGVVSISAGIGLCCTDLLKPAATAYKNAEMHVAFTQPNNNSFAAIMKIIMTTYHSIRMVPR